jgi:hypothetical protein
MSNDIGWGQAVLNNAIGWGQGAVNNFISWGLFHKTVNSWSGETEIYGLNAITSAFLTRGLADGGTAESILCVNEITQNL